MAEKSTVSPADRLKAWLGENIMRSAQIKDHCHGLRVTLEDNEGDICMDVEKTLDEALTAVLNSVDSAMSMRAGRLLQTAQSILEDHEKDAEHWRNRVKELKRTAHVGAGDAEAYLHSH
jgi:hypothetical protein